MAQTALFVDPAVLAQSVRNAYPKMPEHLVLELTELVIAEDDGYSEELYSFLFDYYCNNGEMPYGVAKARSGDPFEWINTAVASALKV